MGRALSRGVRRSRAGEVVVVKCVNEKCRRETIKREQRSQRARSSRTDLSSTYSTQYYIPQLVQAIVSVFDAFWTRAPRKESDYHFVRTLKTSTSNTKSFLSYGTSPLNSSNCLQSTYQNKKPLPSRRFVSCSGLLAIRV